MPMPAPLLTLAIWMHDLSPFAVRFPDWPFVPAGIRWYGLSYLFGFFLGYLLIRRVARVGVSTLRSAHVLDFIITLAIGVVVGGRLGYVFFYQPWLLWTFSAAPPYWGLLAINHGGMASHGGILGTIIATWYYSYKHRHDLFHLLDLMAFAAPLGLGFGRIANFVNGELIGRPAPAWLPWAVKFPQELFDYPAEAHRVVQAVRTHGYAISAHDPVAWIIARIQHGDHAVAAVVKPFLTPREPSQIYAALLEGLVVFVVLLWIWRKPRIPGVIGAWFGITYGVDRIIDEFWRRPDIFLIHTGAFAELGISRGQWLSAILVIIGLALWWYARRRGRRLHLTPMGSWHRGPWTGQPAKQAVLVEDDESPPDRAPRAIRQAAGKSRN